MALLHIPIFHGISPRRAPRKLDPSQAQTARNCELFSEELRPLKDSIEVNTPTKVGIKQSFYLLQDLWLHWLTDVDVARSPLYLENEGRIHYTGDLNPKSTDRTLAASGGGTDYPTAYYRLGIPRPDTAPTVGHTGGTGNPQERSYIYTFVSPWGEEGPPSPVGTHVGVIDATSWNLTTLDATPENQWSGAEITSIVLSAGTLVTVTLPGTEQHFLETGEYVVISGTIVGTGDLPDDILGTWEVTRIDAQVFTFTLPATSSGTYISGAVIDREAPLQISSWEKRIYRTLAGTFRFVDDTTGTTYNDTTPDELLQEVIPWEELAEKHWWKAPVGNMQGMTSFPGGILCGFYGNTLAFCEPNVTSAWPEEYRYTFNHDIVAIGVVGNSVVVATDGFPSIVTGDHPSAMVSTELEVFQSCVSKRGTVSLFNGVMYPSPDGIVYVPSVGVPSVITKKFFKKKDWDKLNAESFISNHHDDRYYGFYTMAGEEGNESGALIFDPEEPGATFTNLSLEATALHNNLETDELYMMQDGTITQYDSGGSFLTYTWLSKLFTLKYPSCFRACKVKLTIGDGVTSGEEALSIGAAIASLEADLLATELDTGTFGTKNNYISGAIGGFAVGEYTFAGGPYAAAVAAIGAPITAIMRLYAWYKLTPDAGITRNLVIEKNLTDSEPFRLPGGYLSDQVEVEFNCNDVKIHEVLFGSTMHDLGAR